MGSFHIVGPANMEEVLNCVARKEGRVAFLSGGTDFIIDLKEKDLKYHLVIDLSQVRDLNYIQEENGWVKIGAVVSFAQIAASKLVQEKAGCLAQAAGQVGSMQIRNRATMGGNIASASPAGDSLPALLALEASVTIIGPQGKKTVPFDRVITGAGSTCLEEGEFIAEIAVPGLGENDFSGFEKIGSRTAVSIARLSAAAVIKYNREENTVEQAKLAVGALGSKAFRLWEVEKFITGKKVDPNLACLFSQKLQDTVDQAIPGRYSQNYKRHAVQGLADDLLHKLFGSKVDLGGEGGGN